MGSCQSSNKNYVSEKKDVKEYVDVCKKIADDILDKEVANTDKVISSKEEKSNEKTEKVEKYTEGNDREEKNSQKKKIIILNGAPGSGKDTQSRLVTKKYNFKNLTSSEILKKYLEENKKKLHEDIDAHENKLTEQEKSDLEVIEKCFNDGSLIPDDIIVRIFLSCLNSNINDDNCNGILINGFPRTYEQALLFKNENINVDALINIKNEKNCLLNRIKNRMVDPINNINYDGRIIELIKKKKDQGKLNEEENLFCQNEDYNNLSDEVINRLIKRTDDEETIFDKRFNLYTENEEKIINVFSDVCKNVDGEKSINEVFNEICGIIDEVIKNKNS